MHDAITAINAGLEARGFEYRLESSDIDRGFVKGPRETKEWAKTVTVGSQLLCIAGDWRDDAKKFRIYTGKQITATESRAIKKLERSAEKDRDLTRVNAKAIVERLWDREPAIEERSEYMAKKGLPEVPGTKVIRGQDDQQRVLCVPMYDEAGELWNVQKLYVSGEKKFHPKARVKGLFFEIPATPEKQLSSMDARVYFCEGFATGVAIHAATGNHVVVCFSVGNLEPVLRVVGPRVSFQHVVIAGDFDGETFQRVGHNPGMDQAKKLAEKYHVRVAMPVPLGYDIYLTQDFADLPVANRTRALEDWVYTAEQLRSAVFKVKKSLVPANAMKRPIPEETDKPVEPETPAPLPEVAEGGKLLGPLRVAEDLEKLIRPVSANGWTPNYDALNTKDLPDVKVHPKTGNVRVLGTLANLQAIIKFVGATLRYNVIKKDQEWFIPGEEATEDNYFAVLRARFLDLCARVGFPNANLDDYLTYLSEQNQFNPVAAWIESHPWDGKSRLEDLFATVHVVGETEDTDDGRLKHQMKKVFIRKWMLSAIAGAYRPQGVAAPGILVFQGPQYIGKTNWLKSLVPAELGLAIDGKVVNPADKDSVKETVCFWLVELGELDGTFRRAEQAALKAFLTRDRDMFRPAYARKQCNFVRRTVFFGSVNQRNFLTDSTGNRRYWTLETEHLDFSHRINMQQVWAELLVAYRNKSPWWLDDREMSWLNKSNEDFETIDPIEEKLLKKYDWDLPGTPATATDLAEEIGISNPRKSDVNLVAAAARKLAAGKIGPKSHKGGKLLWVGKKRVDDARSNTHAY